MNHAYIPIIGEMSAGKSNFLNAFLGLDDILQTGSSTTTKFVCLIKNSNYTSFYHVIPTKKNGYLIFNKEGNEIKNSEEIRKKIIKINEKLVNGKGNKNDIFYCLETPIKNKLITEQLSNYIFMDIPGLNEDESNYFDEIFSLLTLNDIFFEIIIFNSENGFGGDAIPKIIKKLKEKNCLKMKKNLYILNKIDKRSNPEECIENFKKFFYDNFQDEKKNIDVEINIYNNEFVPLSSLLYQAEIKYKEDFYYFLMIFLIQYIKELTKEESFSEFLDKKIENIIIQNEVDQTKIEEIEDVDNLEENDMEIINKSISKLKEIIKQLKRDSGFSLGINDEVNDEIKKAYLIFKLKLYNNYCFSKSYKILEDAIKNIISNTDDMSCPPSPGIKKNNIITNNNDVLNDMVNFFKEKLGKQLEEHNLEIKIIRDHLYNNKLRIAFIGNISVGKSTVLNCIIGEDILPTKEEDCTFRAIIIKHNKNINDFYLYQTKVIEFGRGSKKYINYIEKDNYYCRGINNINSYLKTKNSDKKMNDKDTALIIQGRLKIFDFIKLDENLINRIEFIDLPGLNRKDGEEIDKKFYEQILEYCNSCIYINLPAIKDGTNSDNIRNNYLKDKNNFSLNLRNEFLGSCLFLINRADEIQDDNEKIKIKNDLIKILLNVEKNVEKNINVCFFSGKFFLIYLEHYNMYVNALENSPFSILYILFEEFSDSWFNKTFSKFIIKKCDKIAETLTIKLKKVKDILVPNDFNNKMICAFNQLFEALGRKFSKKEQEEIIKKLYGLSYEIKNHDFSKTIFSRVFFEKLKEIIIKTDNLQRRNLKIMIDDFFRDVDDFFKRNVIEKNKKEEEKDEKKHDLFKNKMIPRIDSLLNEKSNHLKQIIDKTKKACLTIIDDEITNADSRLKSADNDLKKASSVLEKKLQEKITDMKKECEEEVKTTGKEIEKETKESIDIYFSSNDLSFSTVEISELKASFLSLVTGALGAVLSGSGLYFGGAAIASGIAAGTVSLTAITSFIGSFFGPIGIIGGLAVGALIGGLVFYFTKTNKYIESLEKTKPKIEETFTNNERSILKDFDKFKVDLNVELKKKLEIFDKSIEFKKEEMDKIKNQYYILKEKAMSKLKEIFNNIK